MGQCTRVGRILLIDDETLVLDVTKRMLEKMGYQVTAISSSIDAVRLFRADPYLFDLVITDYAMPRMTGDKLAEQVMEVRAGMPVILYTGFSEHITQEKVKEIGISEYVMKPARMEELAGVIRKVMSSVPNRQQPIMPDTGV